MNYDLRNSNKESRKRFVKYANFLLRSQKSNVCLIDESHRTLNQNSYLHVLCRILAADTGVTESYAKEVYFKMLANKDIFVTVTKDPITGNMVKMTKSTTDLTVPEMRRALTNFRNWAAENGYYLPNANMADDGSLSFSEQADKDAFDQAVIQTSTLENYT